jgi:hypothetical protein
MESNHIPETAPIHCLSYDLVVMIFSDVIGDTPHLITPLSHCCVRWRQFALETPAFWTSITFNHQSCRTREAKFGRNRAKPSAPYAWQAAWLVRSATSLLDIKIGQSSGSLPHIGLQSGKMSQIMDLLLPHASRWRSLELREISNKGFQTAFNHLEFCHAENLEVFTALAPDAYVGFKCSLFEGWKNTPRLRCLNIGPGILKKTLNSPNIFSLEALTIQECWHLQFPPEIFNFLARNTLLHHLTCHFIGYEEKILRNQSVSLPNLSSLDLGLLGIRAGEVDFLTRLEIPDLVSLSPCSVIDLEEFAAANFSFNALQKLELRDPHSTHPIHRVLHKFPHLQELGLWQGNLGTVIGDWESHVIRPLCTGLPKLRSLTIHDWYYINPSSSLWGKGINVELINQLITARKSNPNLADLEVLTLGHTRLVVKDNYKDWLAGARESATQE